MADRIPVPGGPQPTGMRLVHAHFSELDQRMVIKKRDLVRLLQDLGAEAREYVRHPSRSALCAWGRKAACQGHLATPFHDLCRVWLENRIGVIADQGDETV